MVDSRDVASKMIASSNSVLELQNIQSEVLSQVRSNLKNVLSRLVGSIPENGNPKDGSQVSGMHTVNSQADAQTFIIAEIEQLALALGEAVGYSGRDVPNSVVGNSNHGYPMDQAARDMGNNYVR